MKHLTEDQLNEYLDNLLDESAHQHVEAHLSQCADCRNQLETLKQVFADLDSLPEVPLTRDLTPSILARLPKKEPVHIWTRALAAQWGVVVGFVFWLTMQIARLIEFLKITLPAILNFDFHNILVRIFPLQFTLPEVHLPELSLNLPTSNLQLSMLGLILLAVSASLLWVLGNVILLRNRQEL